MWAVRRTQPPTTGRYTVQEVLEQQAARQAGFSDNIPLQHRDPSYSTERLGDYPTATSSPSYHTKYPPPPPSQSTSANHSNASASRVSESSHSKGSSLSTSTHPVSSSSSSSAGSFHTQPLSPSVTGQSSWSGADWGHPDYSIHNASIRGDKQVSGLKGWLNRRKAKDEAKSKGKGKAVDQDGIGPEKKKKEKPQFVGGGRGGAQNRRIITPPSTLAAIPESRTHDLDNGSLAPYSRSSHSSSGPLVTFTPDVQEALETLSPTPKFVGGGRGGMQNRKLKDVVKASRTSGSGKSGTTHSGSINTSDSSSSRRSVMSVLSSVKEDHGSGDGSKMVFAGGRGGMQSRKSNVKGIKKEESTRSEGNGGIGITSETVTSTSKSTMDLAGPGRTRGEGSEGR